MKLKIATRSSGLALKQTEIFIDRLVKYCPDVTAEIVHIKTEGDKNHSSPLLSLGGRGAFVGELERALLDGRADVAVHSAKDLPIKLCEGLEIAAVLPRGNPQDVLAVRNCIEILPETEFTVGTGSPRRRLFLKNLYPLAEFKEIRGNVDTRLKKLADGEYDALVLAAAGLERLGVRSNEEFTLCPLDLHRFLPAPCQGIIAVECRKTGNISQIIKAVNDPRTMIEFEAERQVMKSLNAACTDPLGAFAQVNENRITLRVSTDCKNIAEKTANIDRYIDLAKGMAMGIEYK